LLAEIFKIADGNLCLSAEILLDKKPIWCLHTVSIADSPTDLAFYSFPNSTSQIISKHERNLMKDQSKTKQALIEELEQYGSVQKRLEQALRVNEERYRMAQAIGHVGSWAYDLQTANFWGSDEAKRIYGFEPTQTDFTTDQVEGCIPERERVHQALIDLIEKGKTYNLEFEIHPRNSTGPRIISAIGELL
jgi:PAS domain-containing protein